MSFKCIDTLVTPEMLTNFLTLVDEAAGVAIETNNVFDEALDRSH